MMLVRSYIACFVTMLLQLCRYHVLIVVRLAPLYVESGTMVHA